MLSLSGRRKRLVFDDGRITSNGVVSFFLNCRALGSQELTKEYRSVTSAASRVSGAFLTYSEIPSKGAETLVKQSFSSIDTSGTKMHLIAYTNKSALADGTLPTAARDPLVQGMLARRSTAGQDPRQQPGPLVSTSNGANPANSGKRRQYRGSHPALPPIFPIATNPIETNSSASHFSSSLPHPPSTSMMTLPPPRFLDPQYRSQSSSLDSGALRPRSASSLYDDRPRTSSSEPRPNSAYDSQRNQFSNSTSTPFPLPTNPLSHSSSSTRNSFELPSLHRAFGQPYSDSPLPFQHPSTAPSNPPSSSPYPFDRSLSHQSSFPRLPAMQSFDELPTPPQFASSPAIASPFDNYPRSLPPIQDTPPVHSTSRPTSAKRPNSGMQDGVQQAERDAGSLQRSGRGMEDERQLRLLGRTF